MTINVVFINIITLERVKPVYFTYHKYGKVQVGKDQEKAQQKKIPTPKTEVGKNQTNNQVLIP